MKIVTIEEWHEFSLEELNSFTGILKFNSGSTKTFQNGLYHKLDGPAIVWANGTKEYYIHNVRYTEEEYQQLMDFITWKKQQ